MDYYVRFAEHTYCISPPDTGDGPWLDQGSYGLNVYFQGLYRSQHTGLDVDKLFGDGGGIYGYDDIEAGQPAHLVVVEYLDGGTFGSNGYWCIPAIKADANEAVRIERLVYQPNDESVTHTALRPWDGYFAQVQSARVETLIVSP